MKLLKFFGIFFIFCFTHILSVKVKSNRISIDKQERQLNIYDVSIPFMQMQLTEAYEIVKPIRDLFVSEEIQPQEIVYFDHPQLEANEIQEFEQESQQQIQDEKETKVNKLLYQGLKFFNENNYESQNENLKATKDLQFAFDIEQKVEELTKMKIMENEKLQDEINLKKQYLQQLQKNLNTSKNVNETSNEYVKKILIVFLFGYLY